MRSSSKVLIAVAAFGMVHSLFASRYMKDRASALLGERKRNAFYRPFFNAQAVVTSAGLLTYYSSLEARPVWRVRGLIAHLLNLSRVAAIAAMFSAVRQVGFARISGWQNLMLWLRGGRRIPREPEAQGPAFDAPISGPFRFSRHPLNFLAIPLIWLTPRMTEKRLALNCAATLYFLLGSIHEETRLRAAVPGDYQAYQRRVRFLIGRNRPWGAVEVPD